VKSTTYPIDEQKSSCGEYSCLPAYCFLVHYSFIGDGILNLLLSLVDMVCAYLIFLDFPVQAYGMQSNPSNVTDPTPADL
jgi:hypothetical protein